MSLKVYYLDDEPALLEIFVDMFASDAVEVKTFSDPEQAIGAMKLCRPDLLFLDFRLPKTTGLAVAQRIDSSIPKVLMTGDMSVEHGDVFQAVFQKPMNVKAVEAFIQSYLQSAKVS